VSERDVLEKIAAAKPLQFRKAALEFLCAEVSGLELNRPSACYSLLRGMDPEEHVTLEEQEEVARAFETMGALEGLCSRLPALKGRRFAQVVNDCVDLIYLREGGQSPSDVRKRFASKLRAASAKATLRRTEPEKLPVVDGVLTLGVTEPPETRGATISECGHYRYTLTRLWNDSLPLMVFVGLNPSTADADQDDHTVRRWRHYARREGFGGFIAVNLYAYRSTDPKKLLEVEDPIGPECDSWIRNACTGGPGRKVVLCWGAVDDEARAGTVIDAIRRLGHVTWCLGTTKDGHPRHPARLANDVALEEFR
jgi:hypothetical protein